MIEWLWKIYIFDGVLWKFKKNNKMESVIDENFMPSIKEEKIELNNLDETEKDPQIPVKKIFISCNLIYSQLMEIKLSTF